MCLDASNNKSYPTDLPVKNGLVMWMDAADDTTFSYSSGTTVSQWRDKSGFNYHMVPVSAGPTRNAFLNSRKVLAFTTSQDIQNLSIDLRTSPYTVFVVSRYTSPSTGTGRILTSNGGYNNWLLGHWASEINKYYANGWVYNTYVALDTNWKLYLGDWGGPSNDLANFYGAGTAIATNSADASAGPWTLGINASSGERSNCEAAEIIVFNRLLSTTERKQVHTYLGQKWGISNTDRSVFDLAGNDDNGLFGNGTVANMPVYSYYNKGTFKFDGSADYINCGNANALNFGSGDFSVEMWFTRDSNATTNLRLLSKGADSDVSGSAGFAFFGADSGISFAVNPSGARTIISAASYSVGEWVHVVGVVQRGSTMRTYKNAVLTNSATAPAGSVSNASLNLNIGRSSESNSLYWAGNIAIVRIYNKALSVAEIAQNYEAQKSKFVNTIVQQGLVLNLDAGNPYSYAGAGTTWYDVSGNTNNGTLTNGPTYNADVGGNIVFDGSNDYVAITSAASIKNTSTLSLEGWVFISSAMNYYGGVIGKGTSDTDEEYCLLVHSVNSKIYMDVGSTGGPYTDATFSFSLNTWYHIIGTHERVAGSSTIKIYVNGSLLSSSTVNPTNAVNDNATNVSVGSRFNGGTSVWNGKIATARIYTRTLSAAEVLQNYNATKGRFGL
jgi:hypothetical protein